MIGSPNPFRITKASDFSDEQIRTLWIDLAKDGGFFELARPTSPMPMLIVGGKGCGKTHLLRYFSFALQKLRHKGSGLTALKVERYLGIYLRCEGLNSSRFSGKGQDEERWSSVFEHYMELWLARLSVSIVKEIFAESPDLLKHEKKLCKEISSLFDAKGKGFEPTLNAVVDRFVSMQREVDYRVNNAAISRRLDVEIQATRGNLIFGLPEILAENIPLFRGVQFQYLIDELENVNEAQQEYINTLVRERRGPCSFKLGARRYGIRTLRTLSAGEENKEGSEFERLPLEESLRESSSYRVFSTQLIARRVLDAGYLGSRELIQLARELPSYFTTFPESEFSRDELSFAVEKFGKKERPHIKRLRSQLEGHFSSTLRSDRTASSPVKVILDFLRDDTFLLLEKLNILLFYRAWHRGDDLLVAASNIQKQCIAERGNKRDQHYHQALGHFRSDLVAQIYRSCGKSPMYLGLDLFIDMSSGLPRNLLNILKHIFKWALFNGEKLFAERLSIDAQVNGVRQAAEWFFSDASTKGEDGPIVQNCIRRLATLFREIRFSDKPSECSLCTFSANVSNCDPVAQKLIRIAEQYSLLIRVPHGQKDRNSLRIDDKFQLNPMLSPLWDLPTGRRGTISLGKDEVDAIFSVEESPDYKRVFKARLERMMPPKFGKRNSGASETASLQPTLFDE